MYKSKLVVSVVLILFFFAGCATIPQNSSTSQDEKNKVSLVVAPLLKFEDLPAPAGFMMLDKESFAFQNDKNRVALLKYTGARPADQVVAFYKEQMPSYNWNVINIIEYEKRMLNFENSNESCIITIEPHGSKSIITIALSPKSRPIKQQTEKEK